MLVINITLLALAKILNKNNITFTCSTTKEGMMRIKGLDESNVLFYSLEQQAILTARDPSESSWIKIIKKVINDNSTARSRVRSA
jgi:hypothetical protein